MALQNFGSTKSGLQKNTTTNLKGTRQKKIHGIAKRSPWQVGQPQKFAHGNKVGSANRFEALNTCATGENSIPVSLNQRCKEAARVPRGPPISIEISKSQKINPASAAGVSGWYGKQWNPRPAHSIHYNAGIRMVNRRPPQKSSPPRNFVATGANSTKLGEKRIRVEPLSKHPMNPPQVNILENKILKYREEKQAKIYSKSDQKTIIINNQYTDSLCEEYMRQGLFGKWCGYGASTLEIIQWLVLATKGQVSITSLEDNYLFILCNSSELREYILNNQPCFFKDYCFSFFKWRQNFSPKIFENYFVPRWVELPNLQVELLNEHCLIRIGDSLGGFEGFEENYRDFATTRIMAKLHIKDLSLEPIKIITNHSMYVVRPEIYKGRVEQIEVILPCPTLPNPKQHQKDKKIPYEDMVNTTLSPVESGFVREKLGERKTTNIDSTNMNAKSNPDPKPLPREIPTLELEEGEIDCNFEGTSEIPSLMDQDISIPPMGDQTLLKWCMEDHSSEKTDLDCDMEMKQILEKVTQIDNTHENVGFESSPISPLIIETEETEEEYVRRIKPFWSMWAMKQSMT
ncbi:hypothetical protein SUGI_0171010 [Cryptomeria japonica]|nr:hypothetical protein SUGI_0171010 [Cryptomeria japonica]